MDGGGPLVCLACDLELAPAPTELTYLGHTFHVEVPCCPGCGLVVIPEDLARGRMAEVELQMEDK